MKKHGYPKTLYLRLLFTYLPMVVLSVFFITLLLTYTTGNYMKGAMDELYTSTVYSTADVLDSKLSSVYNTMFQLACNRKINDLRTALEPYSVEDLYMIGDIVDELSTAAVCDDMINKIYIYSPSKSYILTGKAKFGNEYFLQDNYPGQDPGEIIGRIMSTGQRGFFSVSQGDDLILTLVTSIPLVSSNPELYICAILNNQELHSPSVITLKNNENLVFLNGQGEIVYNYNPRFGGLDRWDGDLDEIVDKTRSLTYPIRSSQSDITYLYMTQSSFIRDRTLPIILIALLIGSVTIVAVVILVVRSSRRISMPVASLVKLFAVREKEAAGPVGDLDLIRDKVCELYRNQDEMSRRMQNVNAAALEWVLDRLFSRASVPGREARTMEEMNLRFHKGNVSVCVLKILHASALQKQYGPSAFVELKEKMTALIRAQLLPYADSYIVQKENLLYVSVNYDMNPRSFQEVLQEQLYLLQRVFKGTLHLDVHAIVGDILETAGSDRESLLETLYRSFLSAQKCLGLLFFVQEPVIILEAPDRAAPMESGYRFPEESEQALMNCLFAGRSKEAVGILRQLVDYNRRLCDYANMKQLLGELLSVAVKTLLKTNANVDEVLCPRSMLLAECESCDTLEETVEYIAGVYGQTGDYFRSLTMKWPMTKMEVLSYIEENFTRNIGIGDIADHFGLSAGYFSRVFKQMMNDTFLEYLNRYRIEKAEKYILESHTALKDISEKVGFSSYKSFTRSFKKLTLSTPHEYKQKMLGTEYMDAANTN